jgi:hypothetical protein
MLVIHDEQLAKDLQKIAEREHRPVEDILKSMVAQYPPQIAENPTQAESSEAVKGVRRKAYAKARAYWESVGDSAKSTLTDDELDEQFGRFDEEGIPRLKSELKSLEPPPGSLAYAAKIAETSQLNSGKPDLARRSKEILDQFFADDILKRARGEDAGE